MQTLRRALDNDEKGPATCQRCQAISPRFNNFDFMLQEPPPPGAEKRKRRMRHQSSIDGVQMQRLQGGSNANCATVARP